MKIIPRLSKHLRNYLLNMLNYPKNSRTCEIYVQLQNFPIEKRKLSRVTLKILTSCVRMTCHARRQFFVPSCNIFSVPSVLKCNPGKINDKFINLNHFYPVILCRRVFKSKRKRRIIAYGSVTRYGPRASFQ